MRRLMGISMVIMLAFTVAVEAHGGGCRKDSPRGQCCHMEKRVGKVHCH